MTIVGWLQAAFIFALGWLCVKPLGSYMALVFEGRRTFMSPVMVPLENAL